jgi:N-ethylmaleimide reductase
LLQELDKRNIAFIEIRESNDPAGTLNHFNVSPKDQIENVCKALKPYFKGVIVANNGMTAQTGIEKIRAGEA